MAKSTTTFKYRTRSARPKGHLSATATNHFGSWERYVGFPDKCREALLSRGRRVSMEGNPRLSAVIGKKASQLHLHTLPYPLLHRLLGASGGGKYPLPL